MEIEIRAFIEDIDGIKAKLDVIGAKYYSKERIIDYWFCEKDKGKFEQVQQNAPGSYGLRVRQSEKEGKNIFELNCKVLKKEGDHNAFHEFETKIDNFEQTKKILESIGFKIFCTLDKIRITYSFDRCKINIEDIKGFKPAVELEIISDEHVEENKAFLRELLDKLGIDPKNRIEKSITYLYMKEFAFKQV